VSHDIYLVWGGVDKPKQPTVVVRFQITDRFDIRQIAVIVQIRNRLIILIHFIPIAENDGIPIVIQLPVNMVYFEVGVFVNI
jgi:hypothetical protein